MGYLRISVLLWSDMLMRYTLFVMQNYLTDVWKLSFAHAAELLNIWGGICKALPIFLLFFVDTRLGHFTMLVISSIFNGVGASLLTMSMPPVLANATGMCKQYEPECIGQTQKVLFYIGMTLIAVGWAGDFVSVFSFLDYHAYEVPGDFVIWTNVFVVTLVPAVGIISFPYVKEWLLVFGVPGICVVSATLYFLSGWNVYYRPPPEGSPLCGVCSVIVAAALKIFQPLPADANHLYKRDNEYNANIRLTSRFLRCLEKAAIISPHQSVEDQLKNRWKKLCPLEQVEDAKCVVGIIPMGGTIIMCTIVSSMANTFLVEQGSHMNRNLGKWKVPPQILLFLLVFGKKSLSYPAKYLAYNLGLCERRRMIAVTTVFSVLCCASAALIETERLKVVKRHGLINKPDEGVPMSAYWLFFPFSLLAGLEAFLEKSALRSYAVESLESYTLRALETYPMEFHRVIVQYSRHFTGVVLGVGYMCSVLSVYAVGKISEIGGRQSWFQHTLNESRLDLYYWVLAGLSVLNLLISFLLTLNYQRRP